MHLNSLGNLAEVLASIAASDIARCHVNVSSSARRRSRVGEEAYEVELAPPKESPALNLVRTLMPVIPIESRVGIYARDG